jgi:four helix bundle protein
MKVKSFEDLDVWKLSTSLCTKLYLSLEQTQDYALKTQILRSAVSVPSNIAEGFDRKTNKEFLYFLHVARASCGELRTQLIIAKNINWKIQKIENHIDLCRQISAMLYNLIQARKSFE